MGLSKGKPLLTEDEKKQKNVEYNRKSRSNSSQYHAMILYPNEDPGHKVVFDYIVKNEFGAFDDWVYIEHLGEPEVVNFDGEQQSEEQKKKDHIHMVVKFGYRITYNSVLGFFKPYLSHCVPLVRPESYVLYMLHSRPCDAGKIKYSKDSLYFGDGGIFQKMIGQNPHFVQYKQIMDILSLYPNMRTFMENISNSPDLIRIWERDKSYILQLANHFFNFHYKKY